MRTDPGESGCRYRIVVMGLIERGKQRACLHDAERARLYEHAQDRGACCSGSTYTI